MSDNRCYLRVCCRPFLIDYSQNKSIDVIHRNISRTRNIVRTRSISRTDGEEK